MTTYTTEELFPTTVGQSGGGMVVADLTDATAAGRALVTAADEDAQLALLGLENAFVAIGTWDPASGSFPGSATTRIGATFIVQTAGTFGGQSFAAGDLLYAKVANPSTTIFAGNWGRIIGALDVARITSMTSFSATIGDGSSTSITVTHNLNSRDIVVAVRDAATFAKVEVDWVASTANTATFSFAAAPALAAYRVTISI